VVVTLGSPSGFDWPSALTDCASLLGVTLPSLNDVAGHTVTWLVAPSASNWPVSDWCDPATQDCNLATKIQPTDTSIQPDHTATLTYQTGTETLDQSKDGTELTDAVKVQANVGLNTTALQSLISGILLGSVPGAIKVVVGPFLDAMTSTVMGDLTSLAGPTVTATVQIQHHASASVQESCDALFPEAEFPGADSDGVTNTPGSSLCVIVGETDNSKGVEIAETRDYATVITGFDAADAQDQYNTYLGEDSALVPLSPLPNVGDMAAAGWKCTGGGCGGAAVALVGDNVVNLIQTEGNESGTITSDILVTQAVAQLINS
jgi:hypothetical protein